jgi:hypothetical protein
MTRACDECGEKIPAGRLAILPQANTCAPCASDLARRGARAVPPPLSAAKPMKIRRTPAEQAAADSIRTRRRQKKRRKEHARKVAPQ